MLEPFALADGKSHPRASVAWCFAIWLRHVVLEQIRSLKERGVLHGDEGDEGRESCCAPSEQEGNESDEGDEGHEKEAQEARELDEQRYAGRPARLGRREVGRQETDAGDFAQGQEREAGDLLKATGPADV